MRCGSAGLAAEDVVSRRAGVASQLAVAWRVTLCLSHARATMTTPVLAPALWINTDSCWRCLHPLRLSTPQSSPPNLPVCELSRPASARELP